MGVPLDPEQTLFRSAVADAGEVTELKEPFLWAILLGDGPVLDVVLFPNSPIGVGWVIRYRVVTRKRLVRIDSIRQHQYVLAILMFEVIVNPLLLHQAADEIEIRFTVLNTVFPLPI